MEGPSLPVFPATDGGGGVSGMGGAPTGVARRRWIRQRLASAAAQAGDFDFDMVRHLESYPRSPGSGRLEDDVDGDGLLPVKKRMKLPALVDDSSRHSFDPVARNINRSGTSDDCVTNMPTHDNITLPQTGSQGSHPRSPSSNTSLRIENNDVHNRDLRIESAVERMNMNRALVHARDERAQEYDKTVILRSMQRQEHADEKTISDGVDYVSGLQAGRLLFRGTGLDDGRDDLLALVENANLESDILKKAHSTWEESRELKDHLDALNAESRSKRESFLAKEGSQFAAARQEISSKMEFLDRVRDADSKAKNAESVAREANNEAFSMFEKLRKNRALGFDARARIRREMLAKQAEASQLQKTATTANSDALLLKRHIIYQGLEPSTFMSAKEREELATQNKARLEAKTTSRTDTQLEINVKEESSSTNSAASNIDLALKAQTHDASSNGAKVGQEEGPVLSEWEYNLREGFKLAHLDLMDRSKIRVDRMAAAEKARMTADHEEALAITKLIAHEKINGEGSMPEPAAGGVPSSIDHVASAMQTPNVTVQSKLYIGGDADHKANLYSGMTIETAPPFCRDWGFMRCQRKGSECKNRHFYISSAEQKDWVEKRARMDASFETKVLDAISQREHLLVLVQNAARSCKKTFQSHLSGFIKLTDIAPLLGLLNRLRAQTVRVIESIVAWRLSKRAKVDSVQNPGSLSSSCGSFLHQGAWVVKCAYLGQQLYPGSKEFKSKVKRFNRAADPNGKKAVEYRFLGIYGTKLEALRAYDEEIRRLASERKSSLDSFPRPKTLIRSCGKHFAVESDMGVPNTRCEICHAHSFNGFSNYNPSYFWNGQNYLLKILSDTDFLAQVELLKLFFKAQVAARTLTFSANPLFLASDVADGERRVINVRSGSPYGNGVTAHQDINSSLTQKRVAACFGVPTNSVLVRRSNPCFEWFGHVSAKNGRVKIGADEAYVSELVANKEMVRDFIKGHRDTVVEVVDMGRIRAAQAVLAYEQNLYNYMHFSRLRAKKDAFKLAVQQDRIARRADRQRRRENGEEGLETSDEEDADDEEANLEAEEAARELLRRPDDVLTPEEREDLTGVTEPHQPPKHRQLGLAPAEALPQSESHTGYYWDRGEYIALEQTRHERVGRIENKWATGDKYTTFEGMETKGKHMKHWKFEKDLKEKGKALIARRGRIQARLARSLRRKDRCNPDTIRELIDIGRAAGGSLLQMDCEKAIAFLKELERRLKACQVIQRIWRGSKSRARCRRLRRRLACRAAKELDRDRKCVKVASRWTNTVLSKARVNAKRRLKKPMLSFAANFDGEQLLISVHNYLVLDRHRIEEKRIVREPCFACIGNSDRSRSRRGLGWLSVRGQPCAFESLTDVYKAAEAGIVHLHRIREASRGGGPCFCRRVEPTFDKVLVQAYSPLTSASHLKILPLKKSLRCLIRDDSVAKRSAQALHGAVQLRGDLSLHYGEENGFQDAFLTENALKSWVALRSACTRLTRFSASAQVFSARSQERFRVCSDELQWRDRAHRSAQQRFQDTHALKLACQVHKHAMTMASTTAMEFSTRQIELFENVELSISQQAWDPIEKANDAVFIQRKWQARKATLLTTQFRAEALEAAFHAERALCAFHERHKDMSRISKNLEESVSGLSARETEMSRLLGSTQAALFSHIRSCICNKLTLRNGRMGRAGAMRRGLVEWRAKVLNKRFSLQVRDTCDLDVNLLFRQGLRVSSPAFLDFNTRYESGVLSVFEDAVTASSRPVVPGMSHPAWFESQFTRSEGAHESRRISAFDPMNDLHGHRYKFGERELTLHDSLMMLVQHGAEWTQSLQRQWGMGADVRDAVKQPPFLGTLRFSWFFVGSCRHVEWEIDPIELRELLMTCHHNLPGHPIPEVFTFPYIRDELLKEKPITHQSMRAAVQRVRTRVVARLVQLLHVGPFDGELGLGKLYYFRRRRGLFNKLFTTQWWRDLCRGRSCMKGHLIYQGTHIIAQHTAAVNVHENNGDLTIHVCWPRRHKRALRQESEQGAKGFKPGPRMYPRQARVTISDDDIRSAFLSSGNLELFVLWKQSVECCKYPVHVLREILKRLVLTPHTDRRGGLCTNERREKRTPYSGLRTTARALRGGYLRLRSPFSDISDPARGSLEAEPILKLALIEADLFELVHREVLFISGETLTVSGKMNFYGDVLIETTDAKQGKLLLQLSKAQVRNLLQSLNKSELMCRARCAELFALLFSLLAVRLAPVPPEATRDHPMFKRFCKMLQVGVPRGAIVQAVMIDKEQILSGRDKRIVTRLLLQTDHGLPPPDEFTLPERKKQILVLSQSRPEEHFRLVVKTSALTKEGMPVSLDVLERNRNIWLRVRRETSEEKSLRVFHGELDSMAAEDELAHQVRRLESTLAAAKVDLRRIKAQKNFVERHQAITHARSRVHGRNVRKRVKETLKAFVNDLPDRIAVELSASTTGSSTQRPAGLGTIHVSGMESPNNALHALAASGTELRFLHSRCPKRVYDRTSGRKISCVVTVCGLCQFSSLVQVNVYIPSYAITLRRILHAADTHGKVTAQVDALVDNMYPNIRWEVVVRNQHMSARANDGAQSQPVTFRRFIKKERDSSGKTLWTFGKAQVTDQGDVVLSRWRQGDCEVERSISGTTDCKHEICAEMYNSSSPSSKTPSHCEPCFDDGHKLTPRVAECSIQENGVRASLCDDRTSEDPSRKNLGGISISREDLRAAEAPNPTSLAGWREKDEVLSRFLDSSTRVEEDDKVFAELYSTLEASFVGDGPTAGGANCEVGAEARGLKKHSVMLTSKILDILSEGMYATVERSRNAGELIHWLCGRLHFCYGADKNGRKDRLVFDRTILREGKVLQDGSVVIARARISTDGMSLVLDAFCPEHREFTKEKRLEMGLETHHTRLLDSLAWRDDGVRLATATSKRASCGLLLEPRNCKALCRVLFSRALLVQGFELTLDDFESTRRCVEDRLAKERRAVSQAAYLELEREALAASRQIAWCLQQRSDNIRVLLARARAVTEQICLAESIPSWAGMLAEEAHSTELRPFLVANRETIATIDRAFRFYDKNGDGVLSPSDFQQIVHEVGHVMSKAEAKEAMLAIGQQNGCILPMNFTMWWLLQGSKLKQRKKTFSHRRLKTTLVVRQKLGSARRTALGAKARLTTNAEAPTAPSIFVEEEATKQEMTFPARASKITK